MKYLVFLLMFVPAAALSGLMIATIFGDWIVGGVVAAGLLGLSADVCFNGSEK